jgi:hypothetical protein
MTDFTQFGPRSNASFQSGSHPGEPAVRRHLW